jgi:rhomboid family protein
MTYSILAVTFAVWVLYQDAGLDPGQLARSVCNLGLVPGEITHLAPIGASVPIGPGMACVVDNDPINILTPLISIFLHGSWAHILGNSLYFAVFGRAVEDSMGRGRFLAFYLLCGLIAAVTYIVSAPASPVPTVGASGAISGILGAYLVLYPAATVRMFVFVFIVRFRAWVVLLWWFIVQALTGLSELNQMNPAVSGGVAVWAHVGGFLAGVALVKLFVNPELVRARVAARYPQLRPE